VSASVRVLDASVGVKWFRNEPGSREARALLADHIEGREVIAVDTLFFYEVLSVASRGHVPEDALRVWSDLKRLELVTVPLGDELLDAAVRFRAAHGCALYDGFSAGLADLLDAPLYSADLRAHGNHPRVRLVSG
jgi:predicted nucleic acid-binding protein